MIDNMPTCGMCALQFDIEKWEDLPTAKTQLLFYDFPKNDVSFQECRFKRKEFEDFRKENKQQF